MPKEYDVAISFAGSDRYHARELTDTMLKGGISVFYDEYEKANLWGKDLYAYLADLYKNRATYCMILFSDAYSKNIWAQHELKAAQARSLENDQEYILPIRLGKTEIPDTVKSVGYLSWPPETPNSIRDILQVKLGRSAITAAPLSEGATILPYYQLPETIRIVALGPANAGKSLFFLYLVNALLEGGRYAPVDLPDSALGDMSDLLLDIRKSKILEKSNFASRSELIITLEDRQLKKRCSFEFFIPPQGEMFSMEEFDGMREKIRDSDVVLLFVPSNNLDGSSELMAAMQSHLRGMFDDAPTSMIDKPLAVIFTKWDLVREELRAKFKESLSDRSLLMNLLKERFQLGKRAVEHNFSQHAFFYFSIAPLLRAPY